MPTAARASVVTGTVNPVSTNGATNGDLVLTDETTPANGVPASTSVAYQIVVPKAGTYQVALRARGMTGSPVIRMTTTGSGYTTTTSDTSIQVQSGTPWPTNPYTPLNLTFDQPGTYTVTLSAPSGGQGWQLDWLRFTRT